MDIGAFIESGILEKYCLGFCTPEEIIEIEDLSAKHPALKNEIEKIRQHFEEQIHAGAIVPTPAVKIAIMRSVYKQQAAVNKLYAPLIDENISTGELDAWVAYNNITAPKEDFENLFVIELPSTEALINFIVAAKMGHDQEVHADFTEYLFIIRGSCTMSFDGEERSYSTGDIISIQPNINHTAVVTSSHPMLALVQRQFCV